MPNGLFTLKQQVLAIREGGWPGQPPTSVNYLVVAGGGSGGGSLGGSGTGGGGGAGGLLQGNFPITSGTSYTVTVGAGGAALSANSGSAGNSGSSSVFGSISASGGGGGGGSTNNTVSLGVAGGSGGGAGRQSLGVSGGQGTAGQGNAGGSSLYVANAYGCGGGGGAGTVGLGGTGSNGGNGGAGIASDTSGTRTTYAGGGGGGAYNGEPVGAGGVGGGGAGSSSTSVNGTSGAANTGGGGGGAGATAGNNGSAPGSGGSGIVIVSYPGSTQWFTGGVVNYYNGNVIHMFYQSGTLAPTAPTSLLPSYQISRSLRFNSADSAYLNRTPASAGNRRTFTVSLWVKRAALGTLQYLWEGGSPDSITTRLFLRFQTDDTLRMATSGSAIFNTTQVFRDPSAWYHIVVAVDTPNATQANRTRLYVNGTEVTTFSSSSPFSQNDDTGWNMAQAHSIGRSHIDSAGYLSGYLTEMYNIDGQALTPSSFGETNAQTGVWQPKAYTGTYGTNGFYLNFSDNSNTTAATLGKDYSGNGNNWTPNNFSVSAGAGNDSLVDTPTPYGLADTGVGGEVRGNYATWNPVDIRGTGNVMLSLANGNLQATGITSSWRTSKSTIGMSSGKWYCEATLTSISGTLYARLGLANSAAPTDNYLGFDSNGWAFTGSWSVNDVIGIAFDADAGTLAFYLNNSLQGTSYSGLTSGPYFFAISIFDPTVLYVNFGQRPFAYTAPAGFRALTTWNLPTPTIGATTDTQAGKYFNPVLYTGNGNTTAQAITGTGFQPDWVWIKSRSNTYVNLLFDAVRGAGKQLISELTNAETTVANFVSFDSDGFTVNANGGASSYNANGATYVAWQWKANGAGSSNTAGSITSTVSANTTSGFSIVTYTGTGANATVGHGLGVAPSMIIQKNRTGFNWRVYHVSTGNGNELYLDLTTAATSASTWNNTTPTSTVFSIGSGSAINGSGNACVAYCFAPVAGYSAFGSYTGNGSTDGPFVFTNFRPRYILLKVSSVAGDWLVWDTARNTYNVANSILYPNLSNAEATSSIVSIDILSNGFKIRTDVNGMNESGKTFIFAAFAESPFKYSVAR